MQQTFSRSWTSLYCPEIQIECCSVGFRLHQKPGFQNMFNRRKFIGTIPASAVAIAAWNDGCVATAQTSTSADAEFNDVIASPPVVQNPRQDGFGVSIAVSQLATAWVEYGLAEDDLRFTAKASHHGLIAADDQALHVRVSHSELLSAAKTIFYRVIVQPLSYRNAYELQRGVPQSTAIYPLRLPSWDSAKVRVVSINDTHENLETIRKLHAMIEHYAPDALIWNGDTCNDFDAKDSPAQIMLNPSQDKSLAWASTRPLIFSNGNHDVRGERARETIRCFAGCPESIELPYNQSLRMGPLALLTLDTGEDKPDAHHVFAGTAAYEPYRVKQAKWLQQAFDRPEIGSAPLKIAACHIPLRGLQGSNDGTTLEGFASYSGFGASLWLPTLYSHQCQAILSGHTHRDRVDAPTEDAPIHQFVGGGPQPSSATLTIIDAESAGDTATLQIRVVDLAGRRLHEHRWS